MIYFYAALSAKALIDLFGEPVARSFTVAAVVVLICFVAAIPTHAKYPKLHSPKMGLIAEASVLFANLLEVSLDGSPQGWIPNSACPVFHLFPL